MTGSVARAWRRGALAAGALALAGCASSPATTFLALETSRGPTAPGPDMVVEIAEVRLPAVLDRRDLVRQRAGGQVVVAEAAQWAAPLDELVRETLAADLAVRLPRTHVVLPGQPRPDAPRLALYLVVHDFAPRPGGEVELAARWGAMRPSRLGPFEFTTARAVDAPGPAAIARAMSAALGELADAMAVEIAQMEPRDGDA